MAKPKAPILTLVPSGAKLSEIADNLNLLGSIVMPFVIQVLSEQPRLKRDVLEVLRASRAKEPELQGIFDQAIAFIERITSV
jgi:hypothetical protein